MSIQKLVGSRKILKVITDLTKAFWRLRGVKTYLVHTRHSMNTVVFEFVCMWVVINFLKHNLWKFKTLIIAHTLGAKFASLPPIPPLTRILCVIVAMHGESKRCTFATEKTTEIRIQKWSTHRDMLSESVPYCYTQAKHKTCLLRIKSSNIIVNSTKYVSCMNGTLATLACVNFTWWRRENPTAAASNHSTKTRIRNT